MLFNSFEFAVFFPTVVLLYYALPRSARPSLLLIASCAFYMAFIPAYILVLAFIILVDYAAGRLIEASTGFVRRGFLLMSIAANVGTLAVFKYYGFLEANLQVVFVLPPIHPEALELLRQTAWGPRIDACERFMNSLAARHNLPVVGSFDPSASGCDSSQFFDAIHPADSCVAHIIGSWAAAASAKLVKQGAQPRSMF
jgi:hypothetical protein